MVTQRLKPLSNPTFKRHVIVLALWGIGSLGYAASRPTVSSPVKPPVKSATSVAAKTNKTALTPAITQAIAGANPAIAVPISGVNAANGVPDGADNDNLSDDGADDGGEVDITSTAPIVTNPANQPKDTQPIAPASEQIQQVALGAVSPVTVEKFVKMIDIIRQNYVTNVDDESLFANAMAGTLAGLDPYSEYLDANAFENLRLFTEGDIGSIGVSVSFHADVDSWVFDDVLPNSPAAKAGIQRGNYLHQINDNKLDNTRTPQDVDQLLTGIAGTTARLLVSDKGRRKHLVVVQRTLLQQQAMSANIINGVAVVHIPVFQNNTQQQFLMALTKLNQPFSVLVLDLRNNPGGVLSAANDIASLFMNDKVVAQIKNRQGIQEVIRTHGKAQFADLPLAVLQNRYSASAAEVLASALQNNQRAKVYGETSYGKGSIQSIVPINDNEAVKLTVAHYYSSKGEKIDGVGVKPDVVLTGAETSWLDQVLADLQTTKRSYQFLLKPTPTPQSF
ncbi:c- processing peptidase [Moraxella osloensis]|uniref:Probable CtpA-like serine protease n=1 Tax=Faucicola osloensis TaxID=34062 RepID=A0A378QA07_FAUOS|nr:S41 family peptidase [Moraxella osloensis]AME00741.1 c- processing peptidase [Moraxella osloensis]OBX54657.1 c- processing peptidase [Moraxella osloensis]QPT41665.1 S41 family peptidase [Moraxella osloensis]STY97234.1 Probable CtpA-like serine protease [Moraxella osloensis]